MSRLMLDSALAYVSRGWPIFRLSASKVPLKGTKGHLDATTDPAEVRTWWDVPNAPNIGLACGAIVVLDLDSKDWMTSAWGRELKALIDQHGLPDTAIAATRRGLHLFFTSLPGMEVRVKNEPRTKSGDPGVDIKGAGGYVVLAPSFSRGFTYHWIKDCPPAPMPTWLVEWISSLGGLRAPLSRAGRPTYLQQSAAPDLVQRARTALRDDFNPEEIEKLRSALAVIPADAYDTWYQVGMALHSLEWERSDGTSQSFDLWDEWSAKSPKYAPASVEEKWASFDRSSRGDISIGSVFYLAKQHGWIAPHREIIPPEQAQYIGTLSQFNGAQINGSAVNGHHGPIPGTELVFSAKSGDPLIELNNQFSVIGNLGGKCLVMEWVDSPADKAVQIPSFQSFNAFSERFAHKYVSRIVENKKGEKEEKSEALGRSWLKWNARRTYEYLDLDPTQGPLLRKGGLNLWRGFGVPPTPGRWDRMRNHICEILADGDTAAAAYILKWSAWTVQNAADQPETALVFRGGKGIGKGTFGHAMRRLFGQHGLHIYNTKQLTGQFNGHLRNTILLLADEAFWAGDKQGESTLKALLTEPTMMVENKGIDATPWKNRLHVIMLANAEWVVPATADERRYAVFNVADRHQRDRKYFDRIHTELEAGGLSAMLHDLQAMDLQGWHPRDLLETKALREQKAQSFSPLDEWWEGLLQSGYMPMMDADGRVPAYGLLNLAREAAPRLRDCSAQQLGRYLKKRGGIAWHTARGQVWRFPMLDAVRQDWARRYGGWDWDEAVTGWQHK